MIDASDLIPAGEPLAKLALSRSTGALDVRPRMIDASDLIPAGEPLAKLALSRSTGALDVRPRMIDASDLIPAGEPLAKLAPRSSTSSDDLCERASTAPPATQSNLTLCRLLSQPHFHNAPATPALDFNRAWRANLEQQRSAGAPRLAGGMQHNAASVRRQLLTHFHGILGLLRHVI
jgi:hypothetical protein